MNKKTIVDLVERTAATFAQAFLAVIVVDQHLSDLTAVKTAAVAGGLAVGKFLLVKANAYLETTPPTQ